MKFLIIGYGSMGKRHHANILRLMPDAEFVIYDPVLFPESEIVKADAVVIASPTNWHSSQIMLCVAMGMSFMCEKPLGIIELPDTIGVRCAVGFNYRFHRQWGKIGALAESGELNFTARSNGLARYGPTVGGTMTSHAIDMALYWLGPAVKVDIESDGVKLSGLVEHERGTSRYNYDMDSPSRVSIVGNGRQDIQLDPDEASYYHEMRAWLSYLVTGIPDSRLAMLDDGLAVERILAQCR